MRIPVAGVSLALSSVLFLAPTSARQDPAPADKVVAGLALRDGRFIFGKPLERKKGGVLVHFDNGDAFVPEHMIESCFSLDDSFEYEPKNEVEKKRLAKGLIPFRGNWIKKSAAARKLAKLEKELSKELEEQRGLSRWRNRRTTSTKHFKFEHNLPGELFAQLSDLFEVYWDVFSAYWKRKPKYSEKPTVSLYASGQDFHQISGAPRGVLGWYHPTTRDLHFYWDRRDPQYTINVLFHETNHCLADLISGRFDYPDWIEESMAEYFGASKWDPKAPKSKRMTMGHMQPGRLMVVKEDIRKDERLKLKDMIRIPDFGSRHYAWGWTFVHFLMTTKKYEKKFKRYYIDLAHKKGLKRIDGNGGKRTVSPNEAERLLVKYLGVRDIASLQQQWYEYIDSLEVESVGALEQAGRYLSMLGRRKPAKEMLSKAVDRGAKLPRTYATYAELLSSPKERNKAITMIDKAIELDPLEAHFYYIKGQILVDSSKKSMKKEAKRCALLAAEIEPDSWTYQAFAASIEDED